MASHFARDSRANLVRKLKDFPLTYEQHQLLHKPDLSFLVDYLIRKRRPFTVVLFLVATVFFAQGAFAYWSSDHYMTWLILGTLFSIWAYRRHRRIVSLYRLHQDCMATRASSEQEPLTLIEELQLNFSLSYEEHQAIREGDHKLVVNRLLTRCWRNSFLFAVGVFVIANRRLLQKGTEMLPFVCILIFGAIACFARDYAQVRRLKAIVDRHAAA